MVWFCIQQKSSIEIILAFSFLFVNAFIHVQADKFVKSTHDVVVVSSSGQHIVMVGGADKGVMISHNFGTNWTSSADVSVFGVYTSIKMNSDGEHVMVAKKEVMRDQVSHLSEFDVPFFSILISTNYGMKFHPLSLPVDNKKVINAIAMSESTQILYAHIDSELVMSENHGSTWKRSTDILYLEKDKIPLPAIPGQVFLACSTTGKFAYMLQRNVNFNYDDSIDDTNSLFFSNNFGTKWFEVSTKDITCRSGCSFTSLTVHDVNPKNHHGGDTVTIATDAGQVFRSTDFGLSSFKLLTDGIDDCHSLMASEVHVAVQQHSSGVFVLVYNMIVTSYDLIIITKDGGKTWTKIWSSYVGMTHPAVDRAGRHLLGVLPDGSVTTYVFNDTNQAQSHNLRLRK